MTEQEAIKNLKHLFGEYELDLPCTDSLETLQVVISALEKQIAKKPNYIGPWFECDKCKKRIGIPNYTINLNAHDYCHHCGQKIEWSEI